MFYDPRSNVRPNAVLVNDLDLERDGNAQGPTCQTEFSTTDTASLTITTRSPASTGFNVDWGDGNSEWVSHVGPFSDVNTVHNYSGLTGSKRIVLTGDFNVLLRFQCFDTLFGGKISAFGCFGSLELLRLSTADVSGDISALSILTSLDTLRLDFSLVTGDIGSLATLTGLSRLSLNNTVLEYNSTTLPAWSSATIEIQSCTLTTAEVDNFLIDLAAAGGTNGTLNIAGTNAARSSASDAAKTTLLGNGWTITVNE